MQKRRSVKKSLQLFKRAEALIPGGVQLLSRRPQSFAYGVSPIYAARAKGSHIWDVDGNEYVDTMAGIGAYQIGYCHEPVDRAAARQIARGALYSINHENEIEMAELLREAVPCCEMVRYAKGGGDADAVAVRIARGYTGRDKVLFCGYHGWHDWYIAANLGDEKLEDHLLPGVPSTGVPKALEGTAMPFEYNNLDSLRQALQANRGEVACIMMEVCRYKQPAPGFLEGVRKLATKHRVVLIFDEVNTGFRMALGGAQQYFGVTPDMATFAKAMGNGYPLAAVCGKAEVMDPAKDMFISSTFWSDPVALAAGIAVQKELRRKKIIPTIWRHGERFQAGFRELIERHSLPATVHGYPPLSAISFQHPDPDTSNAIATLLTQELAQRGVFMGGAIFALYKHSAADIRHVLDAADEALALIAKALRDDKVMKLLKVPPRKPLFRRRLV